MCNITLVVDLVRTPNFAHSGTCCSLPSAVLTDTGSGLSEKQRSLVISVMVLLCYISLGALLFSFLLGYSFVNSLFFTVVTLSSLGLGDQTPNTTASRAFLFFFCTIGLILLAFTIALGRETIIERFETSYRRRREALAARTRERKAETKRHLQERRRRREREEEREKALEKGREDVDVSMSRTETLDQRKQSRRLDFDEEREHGLSRPRARINLLLRRLGWMSGYRPSVDASSNGFAMNRTLTEQSISRDEHFKTFKKSLEKEQRREFQLKLGVSLSLFLVFWVMGAVVFRASEGWTFFEGLYFSYTTFTTIGEHPSQFDSWLTEGRLRRLCASIRCWQSVLHRVESVRDRSNDPRPLGRHRILVLPLPLSHRLAQSRHRSLRPLPYRLEPDRPALYSCFADGAGADTRCIARCG